MIVVDLCHHRYLNLLTIYLKVFIIINVLIVNLILITCVLLKIKNCFNCNIYYKKKFNKDLIKKLKNTYSFCNNDLNKFVLLLRKGVYPYEYMDSWEKFNETSLPSKEDLNMEDIDDIDYRHGNNVFKGFKLENLGDYHDLYVQSDTLLLADVFNMFRDMCIKEYELDPAHFLSLPGLAWQACLKKTNIELELLTDYDMLLMVEEIKFTNTISPINKF